MFNKSSNNDNFGKSVQSNKGGFTSKLGFVLAASGSAVGLGNLWRFPYLTAQYGGGAFILCYVLLAIFFGLVMLMLEIGIGRNTGKSVIGAFPLLNKKFKWMGYLSILAPLIIVPYYCVIGGWVLKYAFAYISGSKGIISNDITPAVTQEFFNAFVTNSWQPLVFFLIFAAVTILIVCLGVQKGIEKMSKILMPALAIIAVFLMIYVLCQKNAIKGLEFVLVPKFEDITFNTLLGAIGQLFYSLSIGMCIMITYGSYMKKDVNIKSSSLQIAIFDSAFAFVASLIIIPAVFAFGGGEAALKNQGTSLMFVQLTNVFNNLPGGQIIGMLFFILVFFAAVTSSVSLVETIVAALCENKKIKRLTACIIVFAIIIVLGTLSSLGNGTLSNIQIAGKSILDAFDFLANNIIIPVVAIATCLFAGWFIDKNIIPKEIGLEKNKWLNSYFNAVIKYVAPICILIILVTGLFIQL